ncbi:MAG: hypothetical protein ACK5LZ_03075 [Anaerorhabdus sp.]
MSSNNTTLSPRRIIFSLISFAIIPFAANSISSIIHNDVVAFTLAIHFSSILLFWLNWDLVAIHFHRFIEEWKECSFFVLIGSCILGLMFFLNATYFHAYTLTVNVEDISAISFFIPLILFAYCVLYASVYLITFKCLSDRLVIKKAELTVIFFSSFLFSLFFTVCFVPFDALAWVKAYFFYFFVTIILSYLYNQTKSLMTSLVAFTIVLLVVNCIILFL